MPYNDGEDKPLGKVIDFRSAKKRDDGWYRRALLGTRGNVLSNVANCLLALREDPYWEGRLSRNAFTAQEMLDGKPITDNDVVDVQHWLQLAGLTSVSMATTHSAIMRVAADNEFHPIRDYLDSLVFEGPPRIDQWLATYLKVEESDYASETGRIALIQAVARIYQPGCQADYTLILEGPPGIGKSTACRILAGGDEYFSDSLPEDLGSKDAMAHMSGKWIIELGELDAIGKNEQSTLKKFLTKRDDKFRPAYGMMEVVRPRQCVFIGTTNDDGYLRDPTGNRRYLPNVCRDAIDLEGLARDRDALLAEAVYRFKSGEKWHPDRKFEMENIQPEQEKRLYIDVWHEKVAYFLEGRDQAKIADVLVGALNFDLKFATRADSNRVSSILQALGWVRGKRNGDKVWLRFRDQGTNRDQDSIESV